MRKTAHYYNLFRTGQPFKEYLPHWVPLEEFKPTVGNVSYQDLVLSSEFEKDALLRRLLQQSQDWIVRYTGRTFTGIEQNVVGWVDKSWVESRSGRSRIGVTATRSIDPGLVIQIGDGMGFEPVEFAQVKSVNTDQHGQFWELAIPLKHDRRDGEPIFKVVAGEVHGMTQVPPSIKEATIRLAGNMWHYMVHTPKGRLINFGDIGVSQIDDSIFTDGIKKDLDLWRKKRPMSVIYP